MSEKHHRHFQPVIERPQEACSNSGQRVADHFEDCLEMVEVLPSPDKSIKALEREQQTRVGKRTS
jgi:DNA-damage-inducible protein D